MGSHPAQLNGRGGEDVSTDVVGTGSTQGGRMGSGDITYIHQIKHKGRGVTAGNMLDDDESGSENEIEGYR